ncbi:MAG: tol-pal system protein YbgF, partial [Desulfobacula sp.]|nr:tol-pal system protein YbgF [Desulfobacula sp.]
MEKNIFVQALNSFLESLNMPRYYFLYIITVFILFSGCVVDVQQLTVLENKMAALKAEHQKLSLTQAEKNYAIDSNIKILTEQMDKLSSLDQYAEIKHDIQILKEKNQQLGGMIEEITHFSLTRGGIGTETPEKRLKRLIYQNHLRIAEIEKYLAMKPPVLPDFITLESDSGTAAKMENDSRKSTTQVDMEKALYDAAKKIFDEGDTAKAQVQFKNFLKKYPDSDLAGNAQFWLAESFYATKWYEKAILEYQKVMEDYPKHNKVAGAKLKQGYSFAELGEKTNAGFIL